jgi:hypothetical protein
MMRLTLILLSVLHLHSYAAAQSFRYSDREIYTGMGIRLPMVAAPGDQLHLWSFERYRTRVHQYNSDLNFQQTRVIKVPIKAGFRFEFLKFHSFYYTVMSDSSSSGIYRVDTAGTITDQTEQVLKNVSFRELRPYYFAKGLSKIFLIQKINDDLSSNTVINIHVFDSGFSYLTKLAVNVPHLDAKAQNINLSVIGDDLFLLSHTKNRKSELAFSITKIDAVTQVLSTKLFHTENLQFVEHRIFEMEGGLVLESQVKQQAAGKLPEQFTYLIKMDQDLQVTQTLFLAADEANEMNTGGYYFRPELTLALPEKKFLNISYGRKRDQDTEGSPEVYRFISIDSNFHISNSFVQPTERGKFAPTLTLIKDQTVHFYHEEYVRHQLSMIRKFQVNNSKLEEAPLLLNIKFQYDLRRAVVFGTSFVMPYYRRGSVGLVRVRM